MIFSRQHTSTDKGDFITEFGPVQRLVGFQIYMLLLAAVLLVAEGHPDKVTPLDPVPGFDVPPALPVEPVVDGPRPLPGGRSYVSREQFLAEQELERSRAQRVKRSREQELDIQRRGGWNQLRK